jgi:hypothetical protein
MTYTERSIIRLHQKGYLVDSIARALGEEKSYVGYVLQNYFGYARYEALDGGLTPVVHRS